MKIDDAITPVVSISSDQNDGIVTEGEAISFTLTAVPAPHTPIMVNILVEDLHNHLSTTAISNPIEINTSGVKVVNITTIADSNNVRHGEINISLDAKVNPNYVVTSNTEKRSVRVKVKDEVQPVVSITSVQHDTSITSGENVNFRLVVNPQPITPIRVNLNIDDKDIGYFNRLSAEIPVQMNNGDLC